MKKCLVLLALTAIFCLGLSACGEEGAEGEEPTEPKIEVTPYPLTEVFVTNVKKVDPKEKDRYLRCSITIETTNPQDVTVTFVENEYKIYDTITRILTQMTLEELQSENTMDMLSTRIVNALNEVLEIDSVYRAYFLSFVIQ